ncbi:hypothetical protein [Carboxylicivirga taeanensis]|uniref:hypothetical protein n=1 Tax=Carboxylicivirga taeanensis TaxID=1416875 RepID=UPI003F6E1288
MKILFELNHPAHFYLFINSALALKKESHQVAFVIKKKDILQDLVMPYSDDFIIYNRRNKEKYKGLISNILWMFESNYKMWQFCRKFKPDVLLGSNFSFVHIGSLLGKPTFVCQEDDAEVIQSLVKISYPFACKLILPDVCSAGKYAHKKVAVKSYHELAYLHPEMFTPDASLIADVIDVNKPYFIIRFSGLNAYHDKGKKGISDALATKLIEVLKQHGNIYITSERPLSEEFEPYRINLPPQLIHHALYYAQIFIGDSQTMAAEAGVLGTPFIRFNDFIGQLGYLKELEETYHLGFGIPSSNEDELISTLQQLVHTPNLKEAYAAKRQRMLKEKINYTTFLVDFIKKYLPTD